MRCHWSFEKSRSQEIRFCCIGYGDEGKNVVDLLQGLTWLRFPVVPHLPACSQPQMHVFLPVLWFEQLFWPTAFS